MIQGFNAAGPASDHVPRPMLAKFSLSLVLTGAWITAMRLQQQF